MVLESEESREKAARAADTFVAMCAKGEFKDELVEQIAQHQKSGKLSDLDQRFRELIEQANLTVSDFLLEVRHRVELGCYNDRMIDAIDVNLRKLLAPDAMSTALKAFMRELPSLLGTTR